MSSIVNRNTKAYFPTANTSDYTDPPWLINPDTSAVLNSQEQIPTEFWIVPQFGNPSIVVTADRLAWKRSVAISNLDTERDELLSNPFHFAKDGDHLGPTGRLYSPSRFDMQILTFIVNSIASGIPVPEIVNGFLTWHTTDDTPVEIAEMDIINFQGRYQATRENIRSAYFANLALINSFTTEQEIDSFVPTWPVI